MYSNYTKASNSKRWFRLKDQSLRKSNTIFYKESKKKKKRRATEGKNRAR